ncbi:MAG: type II secretion system F family protein [Bdellovibrionales bacterium]|nr:type II secretion system F family protein [Bdellovibrionales bacterium]
MWEIIDIVFSDSALVFLTLITAFLATVLFSQLILPDEDQAEVRKRLAMTEETAAPQQTTLLKWFKPLYSNVSPFLYSTSIPSFVIHYFESRKTPLHKKLVAANVRNEISPDEFLGLKVVMAFFISLLCFLFITGLGKAIPWVSWPLVPLLGFFYPDFWLQEKIRIRKKAIIRALPYTTDLLTLSVESGLDFIAAISRLCQKSKSNVLIQELEYMLREIRLGTTRSDALRNLNQRLQTEEITSLTTLLIQTDQLGASVGQVLRAQSEQLRARRFQAAETAGARASQIILFPVVFCIFPAIFIVVLGPTIIGFLKGSFF